MATVITIDFLLFSGEIFTAMTSLAISIPIGIAVGIFSIFWQKKKYHDPFLRAVFKGVVIGILTSFPTPLASVVTFMAGLLPIFGKDEKNGGTGTNGDQHP